MKTDLNQAVDDLYGGRHQEVLPEVIQLIGTALRRAEQGQTPDQISTEVGIEPERVRELVIRCRGWELSRQQELKACRLVTLSSSTKFTKRTSN